MATRLQRLIALLDSGTNAAVRHAAAVQLGDIQRQRLQDLFLILAPVVAHLRSPSWETRTAAASAIEEIARAVPDWDPLPSGSVPFDPSSDPTLFEPPDPIDDLSSKLYFADVDFSHVVSLGKPLLASAGAEYDPPPDLAAMDPRERLAYMRRQIREQLGVETAMAGTEVVADSDLLDDADPNKPAAAKAVKEEVMVEEIFEKSRKARSARAPPRNPSPAPPPTPAPSATPTQSSGDDVLDNPNLSARERNMLKRKARMAAKGGGPGFKVRVVDLAGSSHPSPLPTPVRVKLEQGASSSASLDPTDLDSPLSDDSPAPNKIVIAHPSQSQHADADPSSSSDTPPPPPPSDLPLYDPLTHPTWPFSHLCAQLCHDLLSPIWTVRHGAALGLRALLSASGRGAARVPGLPRPANDARHDRWTEDLLVRLVAVLGLDRFADFAGAEGAVCPVRETVGMALGAAVRWCSPAVARTALEKGLLVLMRGAGDGEGWEARYGGAVGVRWWMAVRGDLGSLGDVLRPSIDGDIIDGLSPLVAALVQGLGDPDDDVRAVCAASLVPVAETLPRLLPPRVVFDRVLRAAWDTLGVLDDLTASTASVCELLGKLVGVPEVRAFLGTDSGVDMGVLVRRLLPFFRHSAPGVRSAVVRCLTVLVESAIGATQVDGSGMGTTTAAEWLHTDVVRTLFQNFVLEDRRTVLAATSTAASAVARLFAADKASARAALSLPTLGNMFALIATPVGKPLDTGTMYVAVSNTSDGGGVPAASVKAGRAGKAGKRGKQTAASSSFAASYSGSNSEQWQVLAPHDRAIAAGDLGVVPEDEVWAGRLAGARAIGEVMAVLAGDTDRAGGGTYIEALLARYLQAGWAGQRLIATLAVQSWAGWSLPPSGAGPTEGSAPAHPADTIPELGKLWDLLMSLLVEAEGGTTKTLYLESMPWSARVRGEAQLMLNILAQSGTPVASIPPLHPLPGAAGAGAGLVFAPEAAAALCTDEEFARLLSLIPSPEMREHFKGSLEAARRAVIGANAWYQRQFVDATVRVLGGMAGAVVALGNVPPKINPIVRNLVNSISREKNAQIQEISARWLSKFLVALIEKGGTGPNAADKIVRNVGGFLSGDQVKDGLEVRSDMIPGPGILSIAGWDFESGGADDTIKGRPAITRKASSMLGGESAQNGKRRKTSVGPNQLDLMDVDVRGAIENEDDYQKSLRTVAKRGSEVFFSQLCLDFASSLFEKIPRSFELLKGGLKEFSDQAVDMSQADLTGTVFVQEAVNSLFTLSVLARSLFQTGGSVRDQTLELVPSVAHALRSTHALIRNVAARCIGSLTAAAPRDVFPIVIDRVLPLLDDVTSLHHRQAGAEAVYHIVQSVELRMLLPYLIFLVVPVLRRISDQNNPTRVLCSRTFAELVRIMPLEPGTPDPEGLADHLLAQKREERKFIGQLIGQEKVEEFEVPEGTVKADLRKYQKEGVSWLAFLSRYGLHGILCDDMGLGKTLQTITIIASDHKSRRERFAETNSPADAHLPSLVVCPPTIVAHWFHEIGNFAPQMKALMYQGPAPERLKLRGRLKDNDVVIVSYDTLRLDVDTLSAIDWNFCVLDEGHVIKNPATKLTRATKSLIARHRLVLSGTPVQNKVLELWSLFDFLMPGFLGSQQQFNDRFSKPIAASKDAKSSSKEQEAGSLALESLHRQVLPFILRRMKEQVLDDLPPKIIQDYYCDLSDLQLMLYKEFSESRAQSEIEDSMDVDSGTEEKADKGSGAKHIFQALQYLRKLCNHPALVLSPDHPQYEDVEKLLRKEGSSIRDLKYAPKLLALKELLLGCGIGGETGELGDPGTGQSSTAGTASSSPPVSQHRALIFCQQKQMLDMIENDLFRREMPGVTYMRLDGGVESTKRHDIVRKFNSDPSFDVLLLTTHVGGLGLNLTGADTVIFVEHDWNPMKDLQAMDRAHRIGQKRVVNVYRLITRGSIEEKIMGLQRFKLSIASSVINEKNVGLGTLIGAGGKEELLDLLNPPTSMSSGKAKSAEKKKLGAKENAKDILQSLDAMWDEAQYQEYGGTEFLAKLK